MIKRLLAAALFLLALAPLAVEAQTQSGPKYDSSGRLIINCGTGCSVVTGTVTANQGTANAGGADSWHEDLARVAGTTVSTGAGATGAGSQRVTIAQDSTTVGGSSSLPAGTALIGKTGIDQTTPGTTNGVVVNSSALPSGASTSAAQTTAQTSLTAIAASVAGATPAGTNTIGGTLPVAATSGGAGILCSLQTRAATACSTAAVHNAYGYDVGNAANTTTAWVQFFDVASGSVVLGTTVPRLSIEIPAGGHVVLPVSIGDSYATQVTVGCTTTATGATLVTSNCSINVVGK